jgi:hypothetical protein
MGQGEKWQSKVTTRNEEAEQINTWKVEKLDEASTDDAVRKSFQATLIL